MGENNLLLFTIDGEEGVFVEGGMLNLKMSSLINR